MHLIFYGSLHKRREKAICIALSEGAARHGDKIEGRPRSTYKGPVDMKADGAIAFGVKTGREFFDRHLKRGQSTLLIDKGYVARASHYRIVADGTAETWFGLDNMPDDRWKALGIELRQRKRHGADRPIIIAGSSAKYHRFAGIKEPNAWAKKIVKDIHKSEPERKIIYRPKPSWHEAQDIKGAHFSRAPQKLEEILPGAEYLITHGSAAAADAIIEGVRAICLGDSIARPVSCHEIVRSKAVKFPAEKDRRAWAARLAYCQWTLEEMRSGEAWDHIRGRLLA